MKRGQVDVKTIRWTQIKYHGRPAVALLMMVQVQSPLQGPACAGFQQIARQAWQTSIKAINNYKVKLSESVLQIFDTKINGHGC